MLTFAGRDFLLRNKTAVKLYETYAKDMPIFDYHTHLSPQEICENKHFKNITELWLTHDHYKWRAMRTAGVEESLIMGDADDYDKFLAWARTTERLIGSPLYHWVHLELQRYFDIHEPLTEKSAEIIWTRCNEMLQRKDFCAQGLLKKANVAVICTTDDPADDLHWHKQCLLQELPFKILPTFRPDKLILLKGAQLKAYLMQLSDRTGVMIESFASLKEALINALDHFASMGCIVSDHGFMQFRYCTASDTETETCFQKKLHGLPCDERETAIFNSMLMLFLGAEYQKRAIVMQMHLSAFRNTNSRMFSILGPDSGYDSIGPNISVLDIAAFLDDLAKVEQLPKTIIYPINSSDYSVLSALTVCFSRGSEPGAVQLGNAWWFNDTVRGIRAQLDEMLESGQLSAFVGMLTDSRSLTSFARHDFFRRILCDTLGNIIDRGEYPFDMDTIGKLVRDVCFENAARYFGMADLLHYDPLKTNK